MECCISHRLLSGDLAHDRLSLRTRFGRLPDSVHGDVRKYTHAIARESVGVLVKDEEEVHEIAADSIMLCACAIRDYAARKQEQCYTDPC